LLQLSWFIQTDIPTYASFWRIDHWCTRKLLYIYCITINEVLKLIVAHNVMYTEFNLDSISVSSGRTLLEYFLRFVGHSLKSIDQFFKTTPSSHQWPILNRTLENTQKLFITVCRSLLEKSDYLLNLSFIRFIVKILLNSHQPSTQN